MLGGGNQTRGRWHPRSRSDLRVHVLQPSNLYDSGYQLERTAGQTYGVQTPARPSSNGNSSTPQPRRYAPASRREPHQGRCRSRSPCDGRGRPSTRRERSTKGSRRSLSPSDRRDSNESRRQRPALLDELPEQEKFQDPYVEHDRLRGRRGKHDMMAYRGVEFKWFPAGLQATPLAAAIQTLVDMLKATKLGPRDINGALFRSLPDADIKLLAQNWNVVSAHIFGRLYDDRYRGNRNDVVKIMTNLEPGVVITCPITERMMDDGISLENLERGNGLHGPTITKHRTNVIIQVDVDKRRIEVRPCYGFHGNGHPEADKAEYARLVHQQDTSDYVDENGYPLIHYTGNNHLIKRSYFRLGEPVWISVNKTPYWIEGRLDVDDYKSLGDLIGLSDTHPFVKQGEKLRTVREFSKH